MIHSQFMKIYWTKGWLHPQNTFFTVKNLILRITSSVQMFSDAELLTKYLYKPNFARYYSQNIHSTKHMVPSKVVFLLPRNAGLTTIGSWVYRMPGLETEQCFYTESSVWRYKEMEKNTKTDPGDGAKFAKAVSRPFLLRLLVFSPIWRLQPTLPSLGKPRNQWLLFCSISHCHCRNWKGKFRCHPADSAEPELNQKGVRESGTWAHVPSWSLSCNSGCSTASCQQEQQGRQEWKKDLDPFSDALFSLITNGKLCHTHWRNSLAEIQNQC